jgi:hypothetical protein
VHPKIPLQNLGRQPCDRNIAVTLSRTTSDRDLMDGLILLIRHVSWAETLSTSFGRSNELVSLLIALAAGIALFFQGCWFEKVVVVLTPFFTGLPHFLWSAVPILHIEQYVSCAS